MGDPSQALPVVGPSQLGPHATRLPYWEPEILDSIGNPQNASHELDLGIQDMRELLFSPQEEFLELPAYLGYQLESATPQPLPSASPSNSEGSSGEAAVSDAELPTQETLPIKVENLLDQSAHQQSFEGIITPVKHNRNSLTSTAMVSGELGQSEYRKVDWDNLDGRSQQSRQPNRGVPFTCGCLGSQAPSNYCDASLCAFEFCLPKRSQASLRYLLVLSSHSFW